MENESLKLERMSSAMSVNSVFKFDTTPEEMDYCFDGVGHILSILLESKLNENFFNILYRLKPIRDIDEYLLKFNFDKELALKQNSDLGLVLQFWLQDSKELRADSEAALHNVVKTKEFVKLLDKQESDYLESLEKTLQMLSISDKDQIVGKQQNGSKSAALVESLTAPDSGTGSEKVKKNVEEVKNEAILTMNVNGKSKEFTVKTALIHIQETKTQYDDYLYATQSLCRCVEVLIALNESNRVKLSRWNPTEAALKMRSQLWNIRVEDDKQHQKNETKD